MKKHFLHVQFTFMARDDQMITKFNWMAWSGVRPWHLERNIIPAK